MVLTLGNPAALCDADVAWKEQVAVHLTALKNHSDFDVSTAAEEIAEQIASDLPWLRPRLARDATSMPEPEPGLAGPLNAGLDVKWRLLREHSSNLDLGSYLAIQSPPHGQWAKPAAKQ
eukprot:TRINITY_DN12382_c0_g1_i3.p3 TRINITY_DN12382_c0_g1~~TRINITY_DN12382_c0_g1_i3.p3  ORF type:complete len:119 (-),score=26.20 TRINITY_DN12382_c0_g1_i3:612-968(-)